MPDPSSPRDRADARLERALEAAGRADPRPAFRDRLRFLKERDAAAFQRALRHYEERLVPDIADGDADPLLAWADYGRLLTELTGPGRLVSIDATGRAGASGEQDPPDAMLLHIPEDPTSPVLPIGMPREPSPAQRATFDLLVAGKLSIG